MIDFLSFEDLLQARRLNIYVLLWCTEGEATVVVDGQELPVKTHDVLTITSGQIHQIKGDGKGMVLQFPLSFFCKDDSDTELIFQNGLFCHFGENEVIPILSHEIITQQLDSIQTERIQQPFQFLISIHARIKLILVEINRAKVERGDSIWKPDALFLKFLEFVRGNFEHNYSLSDIADRLGTTEAKLNDQSKQFTGKTAQNVIYGLIASEAKRLLTYRDLSVKEVAYKLGFNDPFYFSNFFKKHTQVSPKAYQSKYYMQT